jgi:hypothetical protein
MDHFYDRGNVIQGSKEVEPGKEVDSMTSLSKYKVLHPTLIHGAKTFRNSGNI